MPCVLLSTKTRSRMAAIALAVAVGALGVAWHQHGSTTLVACASLSLIATALCLARVPRKKGTTRADSAPKLPATAGVANGIESHAQDDTPSLTATTDDNHTDDANLGGSDIPRDPFQPKMPHVPRRVLTTRAAHSTGRHEASYVLAAPCFVGVREAIATALDNVWPQPDLALLTPNGHLVHRHHGEIDTTIPALARPLATGDSVAVRLDADAGRVLFVVNGDHAGPSMPLTVGGAYAFVATDPATASTVSMIADRR
ncbi:SPRY incomplete domain containing protein [Pandoravirus quercus]|uniref:SPRY incomplete domain containing protein n=1 Tax=Pandoravirus quercus TaxID=2107709 RepID=A0A2U7U9E0_9VIRU|nr:SPRY incomplete domain containing protein [Pandoravirus quercus]AVK75012.1 SPRY incomplete domain containing protein [Pandoravirus quercus]